MISISVIIPTYNRSKILARCLAVLAAQTLTKDRFEVIVIDNGSTDDTQNVCEKMSRYFPNFLAIWDERPGLLVGRHVGADRAKGDILVYFDDDVEPFPNHLETVLVALANPSIALVGGKCLPKFETAIPEWFKDFIDPIGGGWAIYAYSLIDQGDTAKVSNPDFVFGCNFTIRKEALIKAGGFHPDSVPKDLMQWCGDGETGLGRKIGSFGYNTFYVPFCGVHHLVSSDRLTPGYIYDRFYYQGVVDSYTQTRTLARCLENNEIEDLLSASGFIEAPSNFDDERLAVATQKSAGFEAGVRFHQESVRSNPAVLEWVLRQDYFDPKIPA